MSDMLADGLGFLTVQLATFAFQPAVYATGTDAVPVRATFGPKLLKVNDEIGNVHLQWTDMDFILPAADLVINGVPIKPNRGDTIAITVNGSTEVFEVAAQGEEGAARLADPHGSCWRVHTKHVETFYLP